jgi:15-cis-phytoene desaturase
VGAGGHSDVIVIGGGVAGLSCAVALADRGRKVLVLEAEAELGGRARSWRDRVTQDVVDIGPHVVHSGYDNFFALLARVGMRDGIQWECRQVLTIATTPGPLELRHRVLPPPFSLLIDMARAPGLRLRDKISNVVPTLRVAQYDEDQLAELDERTGLEFLEDTGATSRMIDWFWRLASMTVMNVPLERCSAASLLRVVSHLIGHRGLQFGFPAVGLSDLYVEPAIRALRASGSEVRTRARAVSLGDAGRCSVRLAGGSELTAGHIVCAVPPAELSSLWPATVDASFEPSPYISVYIWFDRRLTSRRFWTLPWAPDRLNYDFYDLANIRPDLRDQGSVLASNIIYSHRAHELSDAEILERTLAEVALFTPMVKRARVLHADLHRIPMAIPCPLPGFERQRPGASTPRSRIHLAGDWTRTALPCSMESAARSGYLAAEAVLAADGAASAVAIEPRPTEALAGWIRSRASQGRNPGRVS